VSSMSGRGLIDLQVEVSAIGSVTKGLVELYDSVEVVETNSAPLAKCW
jgi:hypothetical protein